MLCYYETSQKKKEIVKGIVYEAKLILFIIPALAIWEVLYQLVIIRLIPAAKNDTVHGVGFVVLVAAAWLIYRKKAGTEYEEEDQDA